MCLAVVGQPPSAHQSPAASVNERYAMPTSMALRPTNGDEKLPVEPYPPVTARERFSAFNPEILRSARIHLIDAEAPSSWFPDRRPSIQPQTAKSGSP
jgi:hypothetical protein